MEVLNNIISLLKTYNRKQIDLTNYLGLSKNIFTDWKSGKNTSYMKHLPEIADFFGVPVDALLGKNANDNFTFAMYSEITHDLTPDKIEQLRKYAEFLRNN